MSDDQMDHKNSKRITPPAFKSNVEDLGIGLQKSAEPKLQSPARRENEEVIGPGPGTETKGSKWRQEREAFIKAMQISKKIQKLEKDGTFSTLNKDEQNK